MNQGPSFKYLFIVTAIAIIAFVARYWQGSLDTYAYVLAGIMVVGLGFVFRRRWRTYKADLRQIGDENELQCLEEMARDYAQGRYDNRQYIERCFDEFEREHELPSVTVKRRLDIVRRDLESGHSMRNKKHAGDL
jgi:hypothetical protein